MQTRESTVNKFRARYTKSFSLPKGAKGGSPLILDLGRIGDVAEIRVNGQLIGTTWHAPYYRADAPLRSSGLIGPVRLLRGQPD